MPKFEIFICISSFLKLIKGADFVTRRQFVFNKIDYLTIKVPKFCICYDYLLDHLDAENCCCWNLLLLIIKCPKIGCWSCLRNRILLVLFIQRTLISLIIIVMPSIVVKRVSLSSWITLCEIWPTGSKAKNSRLGDLTFCLYLTAIYYNTQHWSISDFFLCMEYVCTLDYICHSLSWGFSVESVVI